MVGLYRRLNNKGIKKGERDKGSIRSIWIKRNYGKKDYGGRKRIRNSGEIGRIYWEKD